MREDARPILIATWIGIIVNLLLTIIKGVAGIIANSRALIADAVHSASDIISSVVILFGVKIAMKPPDQEHPYGHGKAENIASIIVALLLILVGVEISISSLKIFWGEMPSAPRKLALYAIILSIVIKELLFQYKYRVGKKYRSAALISDAWHHRSDSLSSIAALVGVGAAMIGESYNMSLLLYGDAVASIIVSFIVIKVGYKLAKESSLVMMEQVLDSEDVKTYKQTVRSVDGVLRIDQMHARTHGSYVVIDIKISVDPDLTVKKGHHIATNVKQTLMDKHDDIADVLVHVNPY